MTRHEYANLTESVRTKNTGMIIMREDEYAHFIDLILELRTARKKFPPFISNHEAYAVLREEVDELWDEIKKVKDSYRKSDKLGPIRREALQVAAMAMRLVIERTD